MGSAPSDFVWTGEESDRCGDVITRAHRRILDLEDALRWAVDWINFTKEVPVPDDEADELAAYVKARELLETSS